MNLLDCLYEATNSGQSAAKLAAFDKEVSFQLTAQPDEGSSRATMLCMRGAARTLRGFTELARDDFWEAARRVPRSAAPILNLALVDQACERWELAESSFRLATDLARKNGQPHLQRHAEALAQSHGMPLEVVCRRLQAVVDMPGMHLTGPALRACQQQRRRIRTAAERHRQRQRRRAGSKRGHRAFHRLGGAAVRW